MDEKFNIIWQVYLSSRQNWFFFVPLIGIAVQTEVCACRHIL
jgi:hypothetical protein